MTFRSAQSLPRRKRTGDERNILIHLHAIADLAGFADDCPGTVINEKVRPNFRTWMNINASPGVSPFGHNARNQSDFQTIELMREPLHRNRLNKWIGYNHFL